MLDTLANVVQILTVILTAIGLVWKYREKLEDWYYVASYQLTKPFKPPPKTIATVAATVVGRTRSRYDPYNGEYIISHVDLDED